MTKRITLAITTAVVLVVAIIALTSIALWGPDDSRAELLTGGGLLAAVILASMRELFSLMDRDGPGPGASAAIIFAIAAISTVVPGCAGAQTAISGQATVHRAHQARRFDFFAALDTRCGAEHQELVPYRRCMLAARSIARSADSYRASLESAQHLLDVGDESGFLAWAPDLVDAAEDLIRALTEAGLAVPGTLADVAELLSGGDGD